jgi:hypothetical protein
VLGGRHEPVKLYADPDIQKQKCPLHPPAPTLGALRLAAQEQSLFAFYGAAADRDGFQRLRTSPSVQTLADIGFASARPTQNNGRVQLP